MPETLGVRRVIVIFGLFLTFAAAAAPSAQAAKARPRGDGHCLQVAARRRNGTRMIAKGQPCYLMARARIALVRRRPHRAAHAAAVAPTCPAANVPVEAANAASSAATVECLVNRLRFAHGLQPLRSSAPLAAAAQRHGDEMVQQHFFAHVSPSGSTITRRDLEAGYLAESDAGWVVGENLAWGTLGRSTPEAIVAAWEASPEHLENMLEGRYTETGVAVLAAIPLEGEQLGGATYVQEFGTVVR